ncbi:hypothetical protein C2845_PM12G04900 [Panicum miliaceum]|uniref:Protein kinase domain-containing protein n=1 Tax=Panicum miliaceum TaxID=4540 RepID=A0A3L6QKK2_PANMI|nr:hypothetical protein C2845_PM12G04900 [Panicum miliaceum]
MLNSFNSYKTSKKSAAVMMDYTSLEAATGKFGESSVLGVGGFGCVYKANFDGGFAAAVKRLGNETQTCQKEFEAMPQLTDRSKLPNIIDPMIKNTMDLKHLYQVAAVAVLCVQPEPSYRPLITDVLHSLVPLVPMELGGTLRISPESPYATQKHSPC